MLSHARQVISLGTLAGTQERSAWDVLWVRMRSRDGLHLIQGQLREDRLVTQRVVLADTLFQESVPEVASGSCNRN